MCSIAKLRRKQRGSTSAGSPFSKKKGYRLTFNRFQGIVRQTAALLYFWRSLTFLLEFLNVEMGSIKGGAIATLTMPSGGAPADATGRGTRAITQDERLIKSAGYNAPLMAYMTLVDPRHHRLCLALIPSLRATVSGKESRTAPRGTLCPARRGSRHS